MTGDNRIANAVAEMAAAQDALRVAEVALGLAIRRDAMSRAYFALFHAARAMLLLEGVEPNPHAGDAPRTPGHTYVVHLLGEHLLRPGKLDRPALALVTRMEAYREASDYAYEFDIPPDDAAREVEAVRAFVLQAEAVVGEAVKLAPVAPPLPPSRPPPDFGSIPVSRPAPESAETPASRPPPEFGRKR
jgi:uncharacterized protein (UPF0332 family)